MNRAEFLLQLDELLELEPGTLRGDEALEGLDGWGSLAVLGYMAIVNENFGFIVSPAHISACSTVNDLLTLAKCAD
jgi:acyl carrier protein